MAHVGIYFPRDTLKRVDKLRGKYYTRNKFLQKIVEEYLAKGED
jgi:hypothetical protein